MKRIFVTAFFALLAFTACEQVDGPADVPTGEGTMTISVDKTQIESDGKDIATFTIKDANGNILTTEANKGIIFFKNVANGSRLPRYSTGFTSIFVTAGIVCSTIGIFSFCSVVLFHV